MLGNPIFLTRPNPGIIGSSNWGISNYSSTVTSTSLPICPNNAATTVIPFIIPAGPARYVRIVAIPVGLSSTAVAGTNVLVSTWTGNPTSGGSRVSTSFFQVNVASDGLPVATLDGFVQLAAGSYTAQFTCQNNASGTVAVGGQGSVGAYSYVTLV